MIHVVNIGWVAGLLEGDGAFCLDNKKHPYIQVCMTDRDTVEKLSTFLGSNCQGPYTKRGRQLTYHTTCHGTRAIEWMLTVYSLMGKRRKARISEIVALWREDTRIGGKNAVERFRNRLNQQHALLLRAASSVEVRCADTTRIVSDHSDVNTEMGPERDSPPAYFNNTEESVLCPSQ